MLGQRFHRMYTNPIVHLTSVIWHRVYGCQGLDKDPAILELDDPAGQGIGLPRMAGQKNGMPALMI